MPTLFHLLFRRHSYRQIIALADSLLSQKAPPELIIQLLFPIQHLLSAMDSFATLKHALRESDSLVLRATLDLGGLMSSQRTSSPNKSSPHFQLTEDVKHKLLSAACPEVMQDIARKCNEHPSTHVLDALFQGHPANSDAFWLNLLALRCFCRPSFVETLFAYVSQGKLVSDSVARIFVQGILPWDRFPQLLKIWSQLKSKLFDEVICLILAPSTHHHCMLATLNDSCLSLSVI